MINTSHVTAVAITLFSYVLFKRLSSKAVPLPPGTKKLPIIGNLLDMPGGQAWLTYAHWCHEYNSDIIHLSVAGQSVIVSNSAELVNDLLEKSHQSIQVEHSCQCCMT